MLSLSAINNIEYYKNLDQDDYYIEDESLRKIHGKLRKSFEIGDSINEVMFDNLLKSKHPKTGKIIFEANQNVKRAGWDLTFSAPKSVSLLWLTSSSEVRASIEKAVMKSAEFSIDYIEKYIASVKRGKNGAVKEKANAILAILIQHFTSRELDPQLHVHAIIPNIAMSNSKKLMALDSRSIYLNQKVIGAIFRSQLARELMLLDFTLEQDNDSFRCVDIPQHIEPSFSTRTAQIESELDKYYLLSSASSKGDSIKLSTRKKKKRISLSELFPIWKEKLKLALEKIVPNKTHKEVRDSALTRLISKASTFKRSQLEYEIIVDEMLSQKNIVDLKRTLNTELENEELIKICSSDYTTTYTTKYILAVEKELLVVARKLKKNNTQSFLNEELKQALNEFKNKTGLTPTNEQCEALEFASSEGDLTIIQGSAGSGKSSVMFVINAMCKNANKKVIGATIVKKAAQNLLDESGIDSITIHRLKELISDEEKGLRECDVIVLDEAGQIPTYDLLLIAKFALRNNIKVILTGEDKQLDAISHGGALSYLSQELGCYRIEKIQRQNCQINRNIVSNLRDGQTQLAFNSLSKLGSLNFVANRDEASKLLVEKLKQFTRQHPDKEYLVIASKWKHVDEISRQIRNYLKSDGRIENKEFSRECIVSNHQCKLSFAIGDTVRFSRNDYKLGVLNGTIGKITKLIERDGTLLFQIALPNDKMITFSELQYKDENGHLQLSHGYASTVYSSQGQTVQGDSFILWDNSMHRSLTYVAGSRHKEQSNWFFNQSELAEFKENESETYIDIVSKLSSKSLQKKLATSHITMQLNTFNPVSVIY